MELIKIGDEKTKLILKSFELEHYGVTREKKENFKAIQGLLGDLKRKSGIDLLADSVSIRLKFLESGECELTVKKLPAENDFEIRTFVFNKEELDRALRALQNTDYQKNCALYKYEDVYIWEILDKKSSPIPCRLADFGRETVLLSRRNFLTLLCQRVNF